MNRFINRQINPSKESSKYMLNKIGLSTLDELTNGVIPSELRIRRGADLPKASTSERETQQHLRQRASQNQLLRSFIGQGYYPNQGSALIAREVAASTVWQAPILPHLTSTARGKLEALHNFQTMVCSFTGMDGARFAASDQASAAASAMLMMYELRSSTHVYNNDNVFFVDHNIFATTLDLLLTYSEPLGIEIVCDNFDEYEFSGKEFGAFIQYPAANGHINDYDDFCATAHSNSTLVGAWVDLLALTMLKAPASFGVDIVVGSVQRLGINMGFGGLQSAFIASRKEYAKALRGVGSEPSDTLEQPTYTLVASVDTCNKNINTLEASVSSMYAMLHGPQGLTDKALHTHSAALTLGRTIGELGYALTSNQYFDTLEVVDIDAQRIVEQAQKLGVNIYCPDKQTVRITLDELTTVDELNTLASIFAKTAATKHKTIKTIDTSVGILSDMLRTTPLLQEEIFNIYNSAELLRPYIKRLSCKDAEHTMACQNINSQGIELDFFTDPEAIPEFRDLHPYAPAEQTEGFTAIIDATKGYICSLTGFKGVSMQTSSQTDAIYAGLTTLRAYYQNKSQSFRDVVITPEHLSSVVALAGMKGVVIDSNHKGEVNLNDLNTKLTEYSERLACLIVDYPSQQVSLSNDIQQILDWVHDNGAQVYISGHLDSYLTLTSAGHLGADLSHINLGRIFNLPCGELTPLCVATHLAPYLPTHPIVATGGKLGPTAVSDSASANALSIIRVYAGFNTLGEQGISDMVHRKLLNAAYIAHELKGHFNIISTKNTSPDKVVIEFEACTDPRLLPQLLLEAGYSSPEFSTDHPARITIETTGDKTQADRMIAALKGIKQQLQNT